MRRQKASSKKHTGPRLLLIGMVFCVEFVAGCGGDSHGDVSVIDISSSSRVINIGEGTELSIDVSFDSDRIVNGEHLYVVTRLPAQLRFRSGTAEVDGFTTEDDNAVSPSVSNCESGEQFLAFDISNNDLLRASNPSGNADMRLNLTVDGQASGVNATAEAAADERLPAYACGQAFGSQAQTQISVQ